MSEMNREEILRLVNSRSWYHAFEIVPGIVTPGRSQVNPKIALDYFRVPADLSGKTALDIGALDGAYAFEVERRGARVVALDIQDPDRTGFNIAKKLKKSSVKYVRGSVYDLPAKFTGKFDLILFLGVYYHLKNPVLAFERIWQALNQHGVICVEGAILDHADRVDSFWKQRKRLLSQISSLPVTYFTSGEYVSDPSNWYVPTTACLKEWLKASGFKDIRVAERQPNPYSRAGGRADKDAGFSPDEHNLL